jgi:hypothetical protein
VNQDIGSLLFSALLTEQRKASIFSVEEETYILRLSAQYLMAGFILEANKIDKSNIALIAGLKKQRQVSLFKYMSMKQALIDIADTLNTKNIAFVILKGMALNINGIYKPGTRASRDIDILVSKDDIPIAYQAVRSLGFEYLDPRTADQATIFYTHQFPVMTNNQGTLLELHWRVTSTATFQDCPLTEGILGLRQESDTQKGLYIPNVTGMMAHTLYHGLIHHKMNHGPIFLFDLAALYKYNQNQWPADNRLIQQLNLLDEFDKCKRLIEISSKEQDFSGESQALINQLFEDFDWPIDKKLYFSLFGITDKRISIAEILTKCKNGIQGVSYLYQLPTTSLKYWYSFIRELIRASRKFRL